MGNVLFQLLGKNSHTKLLDYVLDQETDVTVQDICRGADLSRKTADKVINSLIIQNILVCTRKVGASRMYQLNKENNISKKLLEFNKAILKNQEDLLKEANKKVIS